MLAAAGIVDPRGLQAQQPVAPARRIGSLDGRRILLLDNKKLGADYGPYAVIREVLREGFPAAEWGFTVDDLTKYPDTALDGVAARLIADQRPDAVVLALADAGVSLATVLLSVALERQGTPTAIVATVLGARVVRGLYAALAPQLDPVVLDTVRTDAPERVRELVRERLAEIGQRLTAGVQGPSAGSGSGARSALDRARDWPDLAQAMREFADWTEAVGIGDGLPLVPPTQRAVDELLGTVRDDPDEMLWEPAVTSGRSLRVRDAAANAAMAAAPAACFPVILAALRAMSRPDYRLSWTATTSNPSGNAVIFSGPQPERFGLSGGPGCLGPGYRTNLAVGRTVSLCVLNVFGARPGEADLTGIGSPAEIAYCLAEAVDASPWPSLAEEIGAGKPGVLVMKAEGPRNVLEHQALTPKGLCEALADTAISVGSNNSYVPGDLLVILNPEHARIFSTSGWTRADVVRALYEMARIPRAKIEGHGIRAARPAFASVLDDVPIVRSTADVHLIVAGGETPQSMVASGFTFSRGQWHEVRS